MVRDSLRSPHPAPSLYGLLFTVTVLFALQGHTITERPWDVARIALPLLAFFAIMWFGAFFVARRMGFRYERTTTIAFTAASNNFELAIAVAIGVFGVTSGEALAGVVGPLIEVPVLVALVYVALWARRRFYARGNRHELLRLRHDRPSELRWSPPVSITVRPFCVSMSSWSPTTGSRSSTLRVNVEPPARLMYCETCLAAHRAVGQGRAS